MTTPLSFHPTTHDGPASWLTYETFYGLKEQPFALCSDPRFFYKSRSHAAAFAELDAGIRRRERLCMLAGDIGAGKTTLCRTVLQSLDRKTFSAFVPDPFTTREDLLKVLLADFGVVSVDDLTSGRLKNATRTELSYVLNDFLDTLSPLKAFVVVFIDEAQNLSLSLLEEVRILSDSAGRDRQLQVVLVGQPELREKLTLSEMRQVDQRISVRAQLEPLDAEGVGGYIAHRLEIAGGSPDRIRFAPDAVETIFRKSGGLPRLINRICDRSLSLGHQRHAAVIEAGLVDAALAGVTSSSAVAGVSAAVASEPPRAPAEHFSARVDEWLSDVDGTIKSIELSTADSFEQRVEPVAEVADSSAGLRQVRKVLSTMTGKNSSSSKTDRVLVPRTYMERMVRRWSRRMAIAAVWVMAVVGLAGNSEGLVALFAEQPLVPASLPPAPSWQSRIAPGISPFPAERAQLLVLESDIDTTAGRYAVQVALFRSAERARQSIKTLGDAGYRAFETPLDLGERGVLMKVEVGPFVTRAAAEAALIRLRSMPDYRDAVLSQ